MPRARPLLVGLLTALLVGGAATATDAPVRMVRPGPDEVVAGPVQFRFEVGPHEPPVARIDVYADGRLVGAARDPEWTLDWEAPVTGGSVSLLAVAYDTEGAPVSRIEHVSRDVGPVFGERITVATVQLYPVVTDWRGGYVLDLERHDFALYEDDERVPIEYFGRQVDDLTLALLLDVSHSMTRDLSAVQTAAAELVSRLDAESRVGVYGFHQGLVEAADTTTQHAVARAAIHDLSAGGGTALYDALYRVLENLRAVPGRKAVVLFSDGMDERSVTPLPTVVEMARDSEVLLYTIGTERSDPERRAREDLRRLSEETGGRFFLLKKFKRLPRILTDILRDLRSQYVVAFEPTPADEPEIRSIRVEVETRNVAVRHRDEYTYQPPG